MSDLCKCQVRSMGKDEIWVAFKFGTAPRLIGAGIGNVGVVGRGKKEICANYVAVNQVYTSHLT